MKKITVAIMTIALALVLAAAAYAAQDALHPRVLVDGREIHPDVPAYINSDNRTMIPYRAVSEALGATVDWNEADQSVTVKYEGRTVVVWIGKNTYTVNGQQKVMDTVPVIKNDRTMIPLRAVAEGLGCEVEWDGITYTVYIVSPKTKSAGIPLKDYHGLDSYLNYLRTYHSWLYDYVINNELVYEPKALPFATPNYGITIYSYQVSDKQVHVVMTEPEHNIYGLLIIKKDGTWTRSSPDKKDYAGAYSVNPDGTVTIHYPLYHAGEWLARPDEIAAMYIETPGIYVKLPY